MNRLPLWTVCRVSLVALVAFPPDGARPASAQEAPAADLAWATLQVARSEDRGIRIAVDEQGNAYVVGYTASPDFPTSGVYSVPWQADRDAFLSKFNSDGDLIWSTCIGGAERDEGAFVFISSTQDLYVVGSTNSGDFPTKGAFSQSRWSSYDPFVMKLRPNGEVVWSTCLPGPYKDYGHAIAEDPHGNVIVVGEYEIVDPYTAVHSCDLLMAKLGPSGELLWTSQLGGSIGDRAYDVTVDSGGEIYVCGWTNSSDFPFTDPLASPVSGNGNALLAKFAADGSMIWSTCIGGGSYEWAYAMDIASQKAPGIYITGWTKSGDFPTSGINYGVTGSTYQDNVFLAKYTEEGKISWATTLGPTEWGSWNLEPLIGGLSVDKAGNVYICGRANQAAFPTRRAYQSQYKSGWKPFVSKFSPHGRLAWSTYFGGRYNDYANDLVVSDSGDLWLTGKTSSDDLPMSPKRIGDTGGEHEVLLSRFVIDDPSSPVLEWSQSDYFANAEAAADPAPQTLEVWNGGVGTLTYDIVASPSWLLTVSPADGQSDLNLNTHTISFKTSQLPSGFYTGSLRILANTENSPVVISVFVFVRGEPLTFEVGKGGGFHFSTIQRAIDLARDGDRVLVYPATYPENIHLRGKDIILRSVDPTDTATVEATIIDGRSSSSVVTFAGTETEKCVLSGFTIRNGKAVCGGGILGNGTRAQIENNLITRNTATATFYSSDPGNIFPAGAGAYGCDGIVRDNRIVANSAKGELIIIVPQTGPWGPYPPPTWPVDIGCGGGLAECNGTVENNHITDNYAVTGGGTFYCDGVIEDNHILGNANGGLYYCDGTIRANVIADSPRGLAGCNGVIEDNYIVGNSGAAVSGGGGTFRNNAVALNGAGVVKFEGDILNNLILANEHGGLLECKGRISNNTIAYNGTPGETGGLVDCVEATITNCIVWGNTVTTGGTPLENCTMPTYSCIQGWTGGGAGNITADPLFVSGPSGDFYLSQIAAGQAAQSPCIDAGSSTALEVGLADRTTRTDAEADEGVVDLGYHSPIRLPVIGFECARGNLNNLAVLGTDAPTRTLTVWNAGEFTLDYTIEATPPWLTVLPANGVSNKPGDRNEHQIVYQTMALPLGDYAGTVTIIAPAAANSPVTIPVNLRVAGTATVAVIRPVGGQLWHEGISVDIEWESYGPCDRVLIDLLRAGYRRVLAGRPHQEGVDTLRYYLPLSLPEADDYRVRVSWTRFPMAVYDESEPFTIVRPRLSVTEPSSATLWFAGERTTIAWTARNFPGPGEVHVDIANGNQSHRLATVPFQIGANSVEITLPADWPMSMDNRVYVRWTANTEVFASSDYFWVPPVQTIAVEPTSVWLACQEHGPVCTGTLHVWDASPPYSSIRFELLHEIAATPTWLSCVEITDSSVEMGTYHTVIVDPSSLSAGDHSGTLTITGFLANNSPFVVPVEISVSPAPTAVRPKSWRLYR